MKILITGQPKSGKSTMLISVLKDIDAKKGFVSKEVSQNGRRTGFMVEDTSGNTAVLAQIDRLSSKKVGHYYVQPNVLDGFVKSLSTFHANELLYIDEIGQMQLYSEKFKSLLKKYLDASNDFIGTITIVYHNELTQQILARPDILLFNISVAKRKAVSECIQSSLQNRRQFNDLPQNLQSHTLKYARQYLASGSYISFIKLFHQALKYFLNNKVQARSNISFLVKGNTSDHELIFISNHDWGCDCPLSNGQKPFAKRGDCSHVQAVRLWIKQNKIET
ncbi:MAG: nucleoside-triphosphatase [Patescibacteria group bacterium]